jgi:hypothetical protein
MQSQLNIWERNINANIGITLQIFWAFKILRRGLAVEIYYWPPICH